jgi:methionine-rich copper-binding protein CopC
LALLSVTFVLAGLALHAGPADAHARYESSTPADGETVSESPDVVEIIFTQEMRRAGGLPTSTVVNESGDIVSLESRLDDENRQLLVIDLAPGLPDGRYTVIYHVLSDADGDDSQGAFHFFVGDATGDDPASTETPTDGTPEPATTSQPTAAPPPSAEDADGDGIPLWSLIVGIVAAAIVAGGAGLAIGRSATR